jgi:hypothetical protein
LQVQSLKGKLLHWGVYSRKPVFTAFSVLFLAVLRRGLYIAIVVSVLTPMLIATALHAIPSLEAIRDLLRVYGDTTLIVMSSEKGFGECYVAKLLNISVSTVDKVIEFPVLAVEAEPSTFLKRLGLPGSNYTAVLVFPRDSFEKLRIPSNVDAIVNGTQIRCTTICCWDSNLALLVSKGILNTSNSYLCLESRESLAVRELESVEKELLGVAKRWTFILILACTPIFYAAQRRVVEALRAEIVVLYSSGASKQGVMISLASVLAALHTASTLFTLALSITLVYVSWSLAKPFIPMLPPSLRTDVVYLALTEILAGALVSCIASRGALKVWQASYA